MIKSAVIKTYETKLHRIMLHDGIIKVYAKGEELDLEGSKEVFKIFEEIAEARRYILIDPTEDQSVSLKAQKFTMQWLNSHDNTVAVITKNKRSKILVDAMIKLFGTKFKLKIFTDSEEAFNWLVKMRNKDLNEV